jgi:hypothetical protein
MIKKITDNYVRFCIHLQRNALNLKKPYWIGLLFVCLVLFQLIHSLLTPLAAKKVESVDTIVPAGYVLVPLTLVNIESIDSMIGDKTLIDIYSIGDDTDGIHGKHLVATHLPLIRSTLEPSQVAVLVDEQDQMTIKALTNPVFAVVKNPNSKKQNFIKPALPEKNKNSNHITYGDSL